MRSLRTPCALLLVTLAVYGCRGAGKEVVRVPDLLEYSGEFREWWDIYSVDHQGEKKVRTKVGYLYRKFDERDPKGVYFVEDREKNRLGFLLADNRAYMITPPEAGQTEPKATPVGTTDLIGGIKRILQVPGTVEIEKVALPGAKA